MRPPSAAVRALPEVGQQALFSRGAPAEAEEVHLDPSRGPRHDLRRKVRGVICVVCGAEWANVPTTRCARVPTYRGWKRVPGTLRTRAGWRAVRRAVLARTAPIAIVERPTYPFVRYALYAERQTRPMRGLSSAQEAALAAGRSCGDCGGPTGLLRRQRFHPAIGEAPPVLCHVCYTRRWDAADLRRRRLLAGELELERLVVVDCETTGLRDARVIELGAWCAEGLLFRRLVNPGPDVPWEEGAIATHGMTAADVADAPAFDDAWRELTAAVEGFGARLGGPTRWGSWTLCDQRWIGEELDRAAWGGPRPDAAAWVDLEAVYRALYAETPRWRGDGVSPDRTRCRLVEACAAEDVASGGHRAAEDARAAYQVLAARVGRLA